MVDEYWYTYQNRGEEGDERYQLQSAENNVNTYQIVNGQIVEW